MIFLKSKDEIDILHEGNKILHSILDVIDLHIVAGENTQTLDNIAESLSKEYGVRPAFKNYKGFPKSLCVSINEEIVHGIPSANRIMYNGDVVSIDFGLEYKGLYADAAKTKIIGQSNSDKINLVNNTLYALNCGIQQMEAGKRINDISAAIDKISKINKYGNIKKFVGHGIGRALHEEPSVLNYVDNRNHNIRLEEGLVLAIEPMFTLGSSDIEILNDGWTAVTKDRSISSHWEVSVAIWNGKPFILGK